jgi:hypothetical protein
MKINDCCDKKCDTHPFDCDIYQKMSRDFLMKQVKESNNYETGIPLFAVWVGSNGFGVIKARGFNFSKTMSPPLLLTLAFANVIDDFDKEEEEEV